MKWLLSICALVCFTSVSAQTMTPILLEAQAGRETGVFSKSPVVQRAIDVTDADRAFHEVL